MKEVKYMITLQLPEDVKAKSTMPDLELMRTPFPGDGVSTLPLPPETTSAEVIIT